MVPILILRFRHGSGPVSYGSGRFSHGSSLICHGSDQPTSY